MRFSQPARGKNKTVNYEGETAYKLWPKLELYTRICTASLQPKFYEDVNSQLGEIRDLIKKVPAEFVAKLAVYAREKMYLRSIPLVLAVELAKIHNGDSLVSRLVERIIQRADELYEILAYYWLANDKEEKLNKLSKQLQKGIARAFLKFDEYQFAKYNRKTEIKLRDVLFLTHPKPRTKEQEQLFKKIANDELTPPYTWETQLSERGNTKEVWEELIDSGKVGYMALLRNLRNILNAQVSGEHLNKVLAYLSNPEAVKKSKQLPFRFLAVYREIKKVASFNFNLVEDALEKAIKASCENIPIDSDSNVLIACDVSGSMENQVSPRSKIQYFDIGIVLGMMLNLKCKKAIVGMFGDTWKVIGVPKDSILRNADEFHRREGEVGYSTNGWKVIEWLNQKELFVDKIMIFTDCQLWDSSLQGKNLKEEWSIYKQTINPRAKLYLFDLAGYGNTPLEVNNNDVFLISGWSEKVFDVLKAIENGKSALDKIEEIELGL